MQAACFLCPWRAKGVRSVFLNVMIVADKEINQSPPLEKMITREKRVGIEARIIGYEMQMTATRGQIIGESFVKINFN